LYAAFVVFYCTVQLGQLPGQRRQDIWIPRRSIGLYKTRFYKHPCAPLCRGLLPTGHLGCAREDFISTHHYVI